MNKQEMIQKYVDLNVKLAEKQAAFNKYFGEGSIAEDIIDEMDMFILHEMLNLDSDETASDELVMDFVHWAQYHDKYSEIYNPETGKLIETVEELMPFLQFND